MGRMIVHHKPRADNCLTLSYCCAPHSQFGGIYKKFWLQLGPKTCLGGGGGGSMPNRPPTQTSWLALESLGRCGDLYGESCQPVLSYSEVRNALSCGLLSLLHSFFPSLSVRRAHLLQCVHPLHLCVLAFDLCRDGEGLVDPWLDVCF